MKYPFFNQTNELKITSLNEDEFEQAFAIEQAAHLFSDSLPIFLSHQGDYYFNLKLVYQDKLIGFLISQVLFEEATLFDIAIHPDYQHQGLGAFLLTHWILKMQQKQATNLLLEVRKSNQTAIALYQRLGFKLIATRRDYYPALNQTREDAFIMQRLF